MAPPQAVDLHAPWESMLFPRESHETLSPRQRHSPDYHPHWPLTDPSRDSAVLARTGESRGGPPGSEHPPCQVTDLSLRELVSVFTQTSEVHGNSRASHDT